MTFTPDGDLINTSVFRQYFELYEQCSVEMDLKFEEFKRVYETTSNVGIMGKCTEQPEL
jgi:hypothetical protein